MYLHKFRASKDFQICNVASLMVAVSTCVLLNPEHKVLTSVFKALSRRETWISVHDSDVFSWLSLTPDVFCAQVTCCSSGQDGSSVSKREPPFPCNELWVLFSCSVIPSGSCHQKSLTISALLTILVLSSNTAAKVLLISIDLWSFSGLWETQLNTEAEMIHFLRASCILPMRSRLPR